MKQTPSSPSPLAALIEPEKATAFVFYKPDDPKQKAMFDNLTQFARGKLMVVKTMPAAGSAKLGVPELPMVVVLDRRGRETGRGTTPDVVVPALRRAMQVGRIDWAMPGEPSGEALKKATGAPSPEMLPGIMRTMSLNPDAMMGIQEIAGKMHFSDGALPRRQKEMVAAYVSALNKCKY
jgi:hypothetical protein